MKFKGKIENSKLAVINQEEFMKTIHKLEGKEITIELKQFRNLRSNQQNKYYWAVIIGILAKELKVEDRELIHDSLRYQFLTETSALCLFGAKSTTSLNTVEFEDYTSEIRQWASKVHKIFIPLPNEVIIYDDFTFSYVS